MKMRFSNLLILTITLLLQSCGSTIEQQPNHASEAIAETHTINLTIPKGFTKESDAQIDPAGDLLFSRWDNPQGEVLEVMEWPNGAVVDRGYMISAAEEPIVVAEEKTDLILTKVFFGTQQEVYCVHLNKGETYYVISGENFDKEKFIQILETVEITKNSQPEP